MLSNLIKGNIDIFLVSETKIDDSFPTSQFLIPGFSPPLRLDRNSYGGGLLLYVRDEIPAKLLICDIAADIECIPVEINLLKKKWLVYGTYNPKRGLISSHLLTIRKSLERFLPLYDNYIIIGDFNVESSNEHMSDFMSSLVLTHLITDPTCFKNIQNPSCIDLIITNRPKSFQHSGVIETGISDFHKLTITVLLYLFN